MTSSLKQKLIRHISKFHNTRIKIAIVGILHLLKRRYIGIYIDPILACNLRCRMCYFSDPNKEKEMRGMVTKEDCQGLARSLFHRALRLQIGCGAEPTLSKEAITLVHLGKQYKIPFISMITNGNLLTLDDITTFAEAGLDELTLSLHGTTQETYEKFMVRGNFDKFMKLLESIKTVQMQYPHLRIRLNYTLNEENLEDLALLPSLIASYSIHTIQIRPVQKIGETAFQNFSMEQLVAQYDHLIEPTIKKLTAMGIAVLCPDKKKIARTSQPPRYLDKVFEHLTYYYFSPQSFDRNGIDFRKNSFETYAQKEKLTKLISKSICNIQNKVQEKGANTTKKLNY